MRQGHGRRVVRPQVYDLVNCTRVRAVPQAVQAAVRDAQRHGQRDVVREELGVARLLPHRSCELVHEQKSAAGAVCAQRMCANARK